MAQFRFVCSFGKSCTFALNVWHQPLVYGAGSQVLTEPSGVWYQGSGKDISCGAGKKTPQMFQ